MPKNDLNLDQTTIPMNSFRKIEYRTIWISLKEFKSFVQTNFVDFTFGQKFTLFRLIFFYYFGTTNKDCSDIFSNFLPLKFLSAHLHNQLTPPPHSLKTLMIFWPTFGFAISGKNSIKKVNLFCASSYKFRYFYYIGCSPIFTIPCRPKFNYKAIDTIF